MELGTGRVPHHTNNIKIKADLSMNKGGTLKVWILVIWPIDSDH